MRKEIAKFACCDCGNIFYSWGATAKRCKICAKAHTLKLNSERPKPKRKKKKSKHNPYANMHNISMLAKEAREHGMSYGKWVASR